MVLVLVVVLVLLGLSVRQLLLVLVLARELELEPPELECCLYSSWDLVTSKDRLSLSAYCRIAHAASISRPRS